MSSDPEFSVVPPMGLIKEAFELSVVPLEPGAVLQPREKLFEAVTESGNGFRGTATASIRIIELPESGAYPAGTYSLGRFAAIGGRGQPVVRELATQEAADYPLTVSNLHVRKGALVQKGDPVCELEDASGRRVRMRSPEAGRILDFEFEEGDTISRRSRFFSLQTERMEVPERDALGMFAWNLSPISSAATRGGKGDEADRDSRPEAPKAVAAKEPASSAETERTPFLIRLWNFAFYGSMAVALIALLGLVFDDQVSWTAERIAQTVERVVDGKRSADVALPAPLSSRESESTPMPGAASGSGTGKGSKSSPGQRVDVLATTAKAVDALNSEPDLATRAEKRGKASEPVRALLQGKWQHTMNEETFSFPGVGSGGSVYYSEDGEERIPLYMIGPMWVTEKKRWELTFQNNKHDIWWRFELYELLEDMMVLKPIDRREFYFYSRID